MLTWQRELLDIPVVKTENNCFPCMWKTEDCLSLSDFCFAFGKQQATQARVRETS